MSTTREALARISLTERDSTSSDSEKVRTMARIARAALAATPEQAPGTTRETLAAECKRLAGEYFDAGVAEGAEGRNHDTPDGVAQRTMRALFDAIDRLRAATPEQAAQPAVPANLRERIAEAHDASLDADHAGCRAILTECLRLLDATPEAPAAPETLVDAFDAATPEQQAAQSADPDIPDIIAGALQTSRAHAWELMRAAVAAEDGEQAAQPDLRRDLMAMARCDRITDAHRVLIGRVIARLGKTALAAAPTVPAPSADEGEAPALAYFAHRMERTLQDFPEDEHPSLHRDFLRDCAAAIRAALSQHNPEGYTTFPCPKCGIERCWPAPWPACMAEGCPTNPEGAS